MLRLDGDLAFDRADGHLSRVIVDADGADGLGEPAAAMPVRLFGQEAPGVVRDAASRPGEPPVLSPEPGLSAALSSLARLDAARVTSPAEASRTALAVAGIAGPQPDAAPVPHSLGRFGLGPG